MSTVVEMQKALMGLSAPLFPVSAAEAHDWLKAHLNKLSDGERMACTLALRAADLYGANRYRESADAYDVAIDVLEELGFRGVADEYRVTVRWMRESPTLRFHETLATERRGGAP